MREDSRLRKYKKFRKEEYESLPPEKREMVDAYAQCFPEVFKEIMDGTVCNSDFSEHLTRYEGFKAGWKARGENKGEKVVGQD
jgi:hypothetical protein